MQKLQRMCGEIPLCAVSGFQVFTLIDQIYLQGTHPPFEVAGRHRVLDHYQVLTA
jgi:hypothetical protein